MVQEVYKTKILFIITKSVWGGAQKYVYDLAVNLPKENFNILVAAGGNGPLIQKLKEAGIKVVKVKNFQRDVSFISDFLAFFEVLRILRIEKPSIIHANSSKAAGIAGIAILIYKIFYKILKPKAYILTPIFTIHGWAFNESRPKWQIFLIKIFSRLTCFFYDKITCVSEFDKQAAIKNKIARKEKLVTIHNGIDINENVFLKKEEAMINIGGLATDISVAKPPRIIIGTVGEFTKNKGQKYLIEAINILNSEPYTLYPIPYTLILGWGENKQELEEEIKELDLKNQIFLIEGISPAAPYLKAFDIFVLPSLKEGLPYTLLEAGLAKLPVITTNVGGIPEIIENEKTGLLVSPADVSSLANAIQKLVEDKNLAENLANNLHQKIISEFSLEKMIRETLKVYS